MRPQVVGADVGEDAPNLRQRHLRPREEVLGRIGVAEDGAQGLVDLVRDRGAQLAGGGQAGGVREFVVARAQLAAQGAQCAALEEDDDRQRGDRGHRDQAGEDG